DALATLDVDDVERLAVVGAQIIRSEEHTSELQSLTNLVCRLLLEKKKKDSERPKLAHRLSPCAVHGRTQPSTLPVLLVSGSPALCEMQFACFLVFFFFFFK